MFTITPKSVTVSRHPAPPRRQIPLSHLIAQNLSSLPCLSFSSLLLDMLFLPEKTHPEATFTHFSRQTWITLVTEKKNHSVQVG